MDVFSAALESGGSFLRDAAIAAAYELGLFDAHIAAHEPGRFDARPAVAEPGRFGPRRDPPTRRMRALLRVLDAIGAFDGPPPPCPAVPREGWGRLAEVIRADRPLPIVGLGPAVSTPGVPAAGDARESAATASLETRYQQHLLVASAPAARELVARLPVWLGREPRSLLDLGGGAGAYTAAFLDAYPAARATIVDREDVIALARDALARFGDRVSFIAGDAREVVADHRRRTDDPIDAYDDRARRTDDRVDVPDDGARASRERVVGQHDVALLANVLHLHGPEACAELCAAAARAADLVVVKDLRPDTLQGRFFALGMAIYTEAGDVYAAGEIRRWLPELSAEHRLEAAEEGFVITAIARPAELSDRRLAGSAIPPGFARVLARALAHDEQVAHDEQFTPDEQPARDALGGAILAHYTRAMPARCAEQLALPIFHTPLDWSRLPRLCAAIDRLRAILADAGVPSAVEQAPTLAALYKRTYYGRLMPLLYGDAHLQRDGEPHAIIDRYLVAPLVHELCHLGPERPPIDPPHLDECIGGWLAIHVHGAFGEDDAIYGAPWLAQVGQAIARTFGIRAVVRAHAGIEPLPAWFTRAAEEMGWRDWTTRRSLHLLADTMDPAPWVALARSRGVPEDPAFDRLVVRDALRAMCVVSERDGAGFRTRAEVPAGPVTIAGGWMTTARRGDVDRVDPRYWVPLGSSHELRIRAIDEIEAISARLCSA